MRYIVSNTVAMILFIPIELFSLRDISEAPTLYMVCLGRSILGSLVSYDKETEKDETIEAGSEELIAF